MTEFDVDVYTYLKNNFDKRRFSLPALYFAGRYVSYAKFFREIDGVAAALYGHGVKKGDFITIALPNVPVALYLFYAAAKLGVSVNLVHPSLPFKQVLAFSQLTSSKFIFLFDAAVNKYADQLADCPIPTVVCSAADNITPIEKLFYNAFTRGKRNNLRHVQTYARFLKTKADDVQVSTPDPSAVAFVMHSSGTTGQAKSAALSHRALNVEAAAVIRVVGVTGEEGKHAMLCTLPMFHAFGLGVCIHCMLTNGITAVLVPRYSAKLMANYIRRGKVTLLAGVPTMYRGLVEQKAFDCRGAGKLVTAFCGGDALEDSLKKRFDEVMIKRGAVCRLYQGYGMTEVCGAFSANCRGESVDGSLGRPLMKDFYACAFDDDGKMLEVGKIGQLYLSAPTFMNGYLDGDDPFCHAYGKKWLKSGDVGYVDEEGYLHFVDRAKRVVKVSGVNVFPSEVERVISHIDGIAEVAVVGAADIRKGNKLVAYVVCDEATLDKVKEVCAASLDKWSMPRAYVRLPALPRNAMGKVDYASKVFASGDTKTED